MLRASACSLTALARFSWKAASSGLVGLVDTTGVVGDSAGASATSAMVNQPRDGTREKSPRRKVLYREEIQAN